MKIRKNKLLNRVIKELPMHYYMCVAIGWSIKYSRLNSDFNDVFKSVQNQLNFNRAGFKAFVRENYPEYKKYLCDSTDSKWIDYRGDEIGDKIIKIKKAYLKSLKDPWYKQTKIEI